MIIDLFNEKLRPISVRRLGESDHDVLFDLHRGNAFYNSCLQKEQITKQQVLDGLFALPPNTKTEQKFYVGFFDNGHMGGELSTDRILDNAATEGDFYVGNVMKDRLSDGNVMNGGFSVSKIKHCGCSDALVGCMDFVEGYPDGQTVFVGLFMLAASRHKQGLGSRMISAFEESAAESGFKKIRLACLINNTVAYNFWTKQGFLENERREDGEGRAVIIMEKSL